MFLLIVTILSRITSRYYYNCIYTVCIRNGLIVFVTGRQFYGCPKPMGTGCRFFMWADDNRVENRVGGNVIGNRRGNTSQNNFAGKIEMKFLIGTGLVIKRMDFILLFPFLIKYCHVMFIIIVFLLGSSRPSGLHFNVPTLFLSILTPIFLPSSCVSLSYFVLVGPMRECLGKHS